MRSRSDKSLQEVHGSIDTTARKKWRKVLAFFGPAYLVSVGYMDPGNWATDIAGGSAFGYSLLWVLLMSNLMALLLQSLTARMGIVAGRDLAQASRESYPKPANFLLYVLAEVAIAACDLAEVLGMAIGLNLLFGMPIIWGVVLTVADTMLLLYLQRLGMRKMEAFIISLVAIIGVSFFVELAFASPDFGEVATGLVPTVPNAAALYIAIGIIGATVMPHNLYLHSAIIQTRKVGDDRKSKKQALKLSTIDLAIALNIAFLVNASILVLAASAFHTRGIHDVETIERAHELLAPLLGTTLAPLLFAVALIASGQSSTITGTMAGQIIMEGHLRISLPFWLRRLVTRLLAVVPAVFVVYFVGPQATGELLVFSQVILSLQLGFAVVPLIHFVSSKQRMGEFAIRWHVQAAAWLITAIVVVFNVKLVYDTLVEWFQADALPVGAGILVAAVAAFLLLFLGYIIVYPLLQRRKGPPVVATAEVPAVE